jgi:hypothetical protein
MGSESIQAHDNVPRQIAKLFAEEFADFLPGWDVKGEYNYAARTSTQLGSLQINKLMHSGPHAWINDALFKLLDGAEFRGFTDEVKTLRLAQLVNFMHEAGSDANFASGGAKTGGYISYSSKADPALIEKFGRTPSQADMFADAKKYLTWDNITGSQAGLDVAALNPRLELVGNRQVLKYEGILDNGSAFSKIDDALDLAEDAGGWKKSTSAQFSAKWAQDNGIKAIAGWRAGGERLCC